MTSITLLQVVTGEQVRTAIRKTSSRIGFDYYSHNDEITVARTFFESAKGTSYSLFSPLPVLSLRFGIIDPAQTYHVLSCQAQIGTLVSDPQQVDEKSRYHEHYERFIAEICEHLS